LIVAALPLRHIFAAFTRLLPKKSQS